VSIHANLSHELDTVKSSLSLQTSRPSLLWWIVLFTCLLHQSTLPLSNFEHIQATLGTDASHPGPRADLPQFDGANPKLWQHRCEEYFRRCGTALSFWPSYASSMFVGDTATWMEVYLN
jgi:hypothetical protein